MCNPLLYNLSPSPRLPYPQPYPIPLDPPAKKRFEDPPAHDRLLHDVPHLVRLHAAVPDPRSCQRVHLTFALVLSVVCGAFRRDVARGDVEDDVSCEGVPANVADESDVVRRWAGAGARGGRGEMKCEVIAEDGAVDAAALVARAVAADQHDGGGHGVGGGGRGRVAKELSSECAVAFLSIRDARYVLKAGEEIC